MNLTHEEKIRSDIPEGWASYSACGTRRELPWSNRVYWDDLVVTSRIKKMNNFCLKMSLWNRYALLPHWTEPRGRGDKELRFHCGKKLSKVNKWTNKQIKKE